MAPHEHVKFRADSETRMFNVQKKHKHKKKSNKDYLKVLSSNLNDDEAKFFEGMMEQLEGRRDTRGNSLKLAYE